MINSVSLTGRLTKDPELRMTQSGTSVTSFTLAVNRRPNSQGQQEADFISCVAWGKTAQVAEQYLHKGSLIGIEGRIQTRSYDNQQGQRVYVTEVVTETLSFLESRQQSTGYAPQPQAQPQPQPQPQPQQYGYGNQQYQEPQYAGSLTAQAEMYDNDTLVINSDDLPF